MHKKLTLIIAIATLAVPATAQGSVDWEGPQANGPVYSAPGFSLDAGKVYWSTVPGVKPYAEACPAGTVLRLIDTDENANMWGRPGTATQPCQVWAEQHFVNETEAMSPGERERVRCAATVHEVGHTLGLPHESAGIVFQDPLHIMGVWPGQLYPQACLDLWPFTKQSPKGGLLPIPRVTKLEAKLAVAKRLNKTWRLATEVTGEWDKVPVEVTVWATKRCQKGKRCKKQVREYWVDRQSGPHLSIMLYSATKPAR